MSRQRVSRRLLQQVQHENRRQPPPDTPQRQPNPNRDRGPLLVKLDEHLAAPTDDFEATTFTATTATAKRTRRVGENGRVRDSHHYELDDQEDDDGNGPITVTNRFPWIWLYEDSYVWIEQFNGEWIPRQPLHCVLQCKTVGAHNKGATQAVAVYWGATAGSEAVVTGETVDAYNRYDDIGDDIWIRVVWVINGWELVTAEC